jgi:hypothetical protein
MSVTNERRPSYENRPAVVGFFGMSEPFVYDVTGATLDEARRLEAII